MVGAIFSHSQPGLSHLLKEGNIKQLKVIVPANIDPSAYLERTVCKELDHLPLDYPRALVQERNVFKGVSLDFYFNRKYPLVRHVFSWKDEGDENEGEKQLEVNGHTEKQQACNNGSRTEVDHGNNDIENNVLMQIKPSPSAEYPSVLVTGKTPIARIAKIHNYRTESLSVFIVPHQESKECLSLLPEVVRKQLSKPTSLKNAALHLALYHKRETFRPSLDKLKGTNLEEKGTSFIYYLHVCKPEADLKVMLQDPEAKLSPFLYSENFQLNWYKEQKLGALSGLEKVISEEEGKQYKRMVFFRDSLAWAGFYKHIHAEVYVMSAEDLKNEPHLEVLNGIILANIQRKTKCSIVITDRLPWSLDQIIQRDVRKLAFPDGNSEPIVRVGFLDKNSHKSAKSIPFFTINPWSQAQCYQSQHHIVSVNTSKHTVSGIGVEPCMHLIRDEMDIMEEISTKDSNEVIGHITHSHRPRPSQAHSSESTCLEIYLKQIGHKVTYTPYSVDEVLDCLIGNSLVQQLKDIASSKDVAHMEIIPVLLKQKAVGRSICSLTPTKSAASKADIDVYIHRNKCLQVGDKKVQSAKFIVRKARTMTVDITLEVSVDSKPLSLKLTECLDRRGSCGQTVADHIYSICSKKDAWFHARKRTVGEVLYIFLREEKALLAIQSLPLFLSFPMIKCNIIHYLTTILVDSSRDLQEAHVYVPSFELAPIFINQKKLSIHVGSLAMHLFPTCDIDQQMIKIEGDCTLNGILPMKFTCNSMADSQKDVKFFFANALPAEEVFELFGVSIAPASLNHPISGFGLNNKVTCEGGFVLSQLLQNTEESSFSSIFFGVEFCSEIEHLLPATLSHIKHAKLKTVVHFPSAQTPMLGLEASFTSNLEVLNSPKIESVMLECCLSVCPSITDGDYVYEVTVRQYSNQYELQECQGMSVYAIISALSGTLGKNVTEEIGKIPEIGDQILNRVSLRKIVLRLLNREIVGFELHATISELDIIPGKISVNDCTLNIFYSKEGLKIECSGNLVFLRHHKYSVHFSLPTTEEKGKLSFSNYDSGLVFKDLMQEFGWLSHDVKSNPVLAEVLDLVVRKVTIDLHFTPEDAKLRITASDVKIFQEKLGIGLVTFQGIELDVSTKLKNGKFITAFSLGASISDALYAQLKYDPEGHNMTGQVRVMFSKSASAMDVMQLFQASTNSYENMKGIIQKDFMDVFNSDLNILTQPGLTASLSVSIGLPSEHAKYYSLEHLKLEMEDALKICYGNYSYVLNSFEFEYVKKSHSKHVASTSHLSLAVHKLNSKENMTLDFDFTSKKDDSNFFTAEVEAGPQGGFLKLSSAIDLARAAVPELPKFDARLPPIFDIELLSGSITFNVRPFFQPTAFDINILIQEWQVFDDPGLTVNKVTLKTTWESGNYLQLTFTDCSLTFFGHKLELTGRLTSEEVYIESCSAQKLPESNPTHFNSILKDCTPKTEPQPVLPTNIGLPPMEVELKELIIQLQEEKRKFRINTSVVARSPWMVKLGLQTIPVHELGGALEWEKLKNKTQYKAFLYGTVKLFGMQVDMEMLLGKNIDSVVSAAVTHPQYLHYGQVADNLLCSEAIVPHDQYNPNNSVLSELVPSTMQDISFVSASTALNVTQKQFFLSSKVQGWGTGSLLMGYLVDKNEMDYIVSLSLDDGIKFGRFSKSLAFVDELVLLRSVDVLVSSTDVEQLSDITDKFSHSFSQSWVCKQLQKPFYESKLLSSPELAYPIQTGTTIYAEIDISQSKGCISKLLQLGDISSLERDMSIVTYIGSAKTNTDLEIHAWIPRILLFEMLKFSELHLLYRVNNASEFELTGTVELHLNVSESMPDSVINFVGKLSVNPEFAKFNTQSCLDIVSQPCGIHVQVNHLELALKMYLNGEIPDVFVSGKLKIDCIDLICKFLLKGIIFKVFQICLVPSLRLSDLFSCCAFDWPIELDIVFKEGRFYYAAADITFEEDGVPFRYEEEYHLEGVITLINIDFRIKVDFLSNQSDMVISGTSVKQISFGFAKITGQHPHTHEGPALKYRVSEKSLALTLGVEILKHPCFEGELKYMFQDDSVEGIIRCPWPFLWTDNPSMKVRWSKEDGFQIIDFLLFGDVPGFSLLGAIAKFTKIIYNIVRGTLSWSVKLRIKTDKNPNPQKHLVKLVLCGEIVINVIGLEMKVFPLPKVPILLPRMDDFSIAKLPQYILKGLWDSIGPICKSLQDYIHPWTLLMKTGELILNSVKGAVKAVVNVAKKVGQDVKKVCRGIRKFFGYSAFIVDVDNGMVLGYICGGKAGQPLNNLEYVVEHFGPILAVNAIGEMAHDVHKHFKSCISAQQYEREDSCEEVDGEKMELEKDLEELKGKAEELSETLTIVADKVLTVTHVSVKVVNGRNGGKKISVQWFVYNCEEKKFYTEDKGDIEYHIKITATVLKGEDIETVPVYDDIFIDKEEEEQLQSEECTSHNQNASEVGLTPTIQTVQQDVGLVADIVKEEQLQPLTEEDALVGDSQEDKDSETTDKQEESAEPDQQPIPKKCITFSTLFDPKILEHTVCINASIQPKVTLQVKMLSPDKIASEEHLIDPDRLEAGDTSWTIDAKKEIESNGRINEVTLEGKRVFEQHIIKPDSEIKVQFTAQCDHQEDGLTVTGDVTPVPEAHCYLVQLVDGADTTVIIKQCQLLPPKLHYEMVALLSDFSETSTGPYHISVIALRADLSTCSAFTYSELKIDRYSPPENLTETLPNLDSSDSDIVRLEWKHPKSSKHKSDEDRTEEVSAAADPQEPQQEEKASEGIESIHSDALMAVPEESTCLAGQEKAPDEPTRLDPPGDDNHGISPTKSAAAEPGDQKQSQKGDHFYILTITGVHVKKAKEDTKFEAVCIDNLEVSEEAFKIIVPVYVEQDSHKQSVGHEFSLINLLKTKEPELQDGPLLFQCQVITNGLSRIHSMPKSFSEFVLLAHPTDLKVATLKPQRAGLHIGWEYCAHAIGYRAELVDQHTKKIAFAKVLKCGTGSHGDAVLFKNDLKDIPFTDTGRGYRLQMYSLGFDQELIRCLKPTVADGIFHVMPVELQYLDDSQVVRVKFRPFTLNTETEYIVELYQITGDSTDEPQHLIDKKIYDHEVCNETVTDFPLKKWQHLLQSGDLVVAWVCSIASSDPGVTYFGAPQEEVCMMDSPKLKSSFVYYPDGTTSGMKLTWSDVTKAQGYQYGYYRSDKNEYVSLMETQDREITIDFNGSSLEQLAHEGSCQFQVYVTAFGKPGAFVVSGALTVDTNKLQCITSSSLEERGAVVFTSITLERMWRKHLIDHAFSHYFSLVINPQHFLFPSGKLFPTCISIPKKLKDKFWKKETQLFGNGKATRIFCSLKIIIALQKRRHLLYI